MADEKDGLPTLSPDDAIKMWKKGKDHWNKWAKDNATYNINTNITKLSFTKVNAARRKNKTIKRYNTFSGLDMSAKIYTFKVDIVCRVVFSPFVPVVLAFFPHLNRIIRTESG